MLPVLAPAAEEEQGAPSLSSKPGPQASRVVATSAGPLPRVWGQLDPSRSWCRPQESWILDLLLNTITALAPTRTRETPGVLDLRSPLPSLHTLLVTSMHFAAHP